MSVTYLDHFGLRQAPFDIASDPALFHNSQGHKRVLDWIESGIASRVPMLLLTGEAGTGKTTLLKLLLHRHSSDWAVGLVSAFHCRGDNILVQARRALGLLDRHSDSPDLSAKRVRRFAEAMRSKDMFTVLVVDAAQALEIDSISALSSLIVDSADGSLLTVLLIGQPELRVRLLAAPELRNLRLDESARAVLVPFSEAETAEYIAQQLARTGARAPIFDASAMRMLHGFSRGVPRLINIMAEHCLRVGASKGLSRLDAGWVRTVLHEATTVGALSHLGVAGEEAPPQPATQSVPPMALRQIPAGPQPALPSSKAGNADRAVPADARPPAAGVQGAHRLAQPQEKGVEQQALPVDRASPAPGPEAPRSYPEAGAAPHGGPVPARPLPARQGRSGKRRALSWAAVVAGVAVAGGAAFLWSQQGPAPRPVATAPAQPSTGAAVGQAAAPRAGQPAAPPATVSSQTAAAVPPPVPVTPEPTVEALMKQALEIEARDPAAAAVAYARAAIRGRARAAYYLGQFYETGTGVEPSAGSARLWYAAAPDLSGAQRRLQALPTAVAAAGTPAAPVPVFQARLSNGTAEMIWRVPEGVTPARFRVETFGPEGEVLASQETTLPGLILRLPVIAWRVTAIGAEGTESAPSAMVRMVPEGE